MTHGQKVTSLLFLLSNPLITNLWARKINIDFVGIESWVGCGCNEVIVDFFYLDVVDRLKVLFFN